MTREQTVAALAREWRTAVSGTGFVPMTQSELEQLLTRLLEQLLTAVTADPFDGAAAADVGAHLVRANLTDPQVLARTSRALAPLAEWMAPLRERVIAGLGELANGYTTELMATRARHQEMLHAAMADARQAAEVRFRVLFDNAAVAIGIGDMAGRVVDANPALAAMLGRPVERLRGLPVSELVHPDDRAELKTRVFDELLGAGSGTTRLELRYTRPDDESGWAAWAITLVPAAGGRSAYLLVVGEDTTQRRALQAELSRQARHDPLTGLPNRRQLVETISEIIAAAGPADRIGIGFIDLDGFKAVNDTYGHGVGDRLLAAVAPRLTARASGAMLARVGGDEFVVLFPPPCDAARVATVTTALLDALSEPITVDDLRLTISACIGAVVTPVVGADAERLLDAADAGLYRAKAAGPNRWVLHNHDITAGAVLPGLH
ncbi:diguanylate cyclase (GGDEF)-like protein/PAS domain S-box-containing protein [Nocardia transvalensis]|uniref:Diguanylate cyclase (GGDEF)-like protein/PAS domain S-box-containing protein n=1 Tax=Nocardia transvalensis TaxID=37333 RepID=A0A7W9P8V4_9NOCA|nr:sensor domain-containing diguanylate cyclase [Nocardia transvalensis]MBB5911338.1 diguanylate cyclase (GGDEF)-like protein/PAS domain S-box-containing protein [Nocardia transvalensis]